MPRLANNSLVVCAALACVCASERALQVGSAHEPPSAPRPTPQRAPGGVPAETGASFDLGTPPAGFRTAVGWMQTVQDTRRDGRGWIEVDWLRLHAVVDGRDRTIANDAYDRGQACGGLYTREPWFADNRQSDMRSEFADGFLVLKPSERPEKVYHWWNCHRATIPLRATRVWADARVRIHGAAAVQLGIDYWRDAEAKYGGYNVNNREAGSSRWYFDDTTDWQVMSVGKPQE